MQKLSHRGFAAVGAMSVSTLFSSITLHLFPSGDAALIYHALGTPWHWQDFLPLFQSGELFQMNILLLLFRKLTYYWTVIKCASVPDQIEKVDDVDMEHRGFSHSIFFMLLLWGGMFLLYLILKDQLHQHEQVLPSWLVQEMWAGCIGVLAGILLHIVADMLSKRGVKAAWPSNVSLSPLPQSLRYSYKKDNEQYLLWLWIFLSGFLFAINVIGF